MLGSRRSPTCTMAALHHDHCHVLFEVTGMAVWILNVLIDTTRHRWRNKNGGPKQLFGRPSFKEREGKGKVSTASFKHGNLPWRHAKPPTITSVPHPYCILIASLSHPHPYCLHVQPYCIPAPSMLDPYHIRRTSTSPSHSHHMRSICVSHVHPHQSHVHPSDIHA